MLFGLLIFISYTNFGRRGGLLDTLKIESASKKYQKKKSYVLFSKAFSPPLKKQELEREINLLAPHIKRD